jgi:hypothetical protein
MQRFLIIFGTTIDNVILSVLVLLENIASSESVFVTEDLDANVNQSSGKGLNIIKNPRISVQILN